ncbi:TPA: hypothetical protein JBE46_00100 [Legionella pneumophila subsp. pneumophila]|uniref:Uncharacterized protein n=2 Tax=Legionella TaxID=445 RepID=Q5ZWM4_LEGPH|nr:hypothetical protein lpg1061 [Legionella pneumophila subsp. pneumophila str. Philadelphia 1]PNL78571.1 hypothetical protein A6J41_011685 [Legionella pneumophila subsp. pneumophila]PPK34409.1 hypothetical protein C3927_04705 [Legionella pneumophila]PYB43271.1 hypothetical protein DM454_12005 [Legionella pneumophila]PYB48973.1 hypothetical protein DM456_12685 [Legionella pneumophila]
MSKNKNRNPMNDITSFKIKKIVLLKIIFAVIFSCTTLNACAGTQSYHIKYHKDSKINNVPLSNTEVLIEFHRAGNSLGRLLTKTNETQDITIDNTYGSNLVIHVLFIEKEGKRIRCWGVSAAKTNTIEIQCDKVVSLKKTKGNTGESTDSIH